MNNQPYKTIIEALASYYNLRHLWIIATALVTNASCNERLHNSEIIFGSLLASYL